MKFLIDYLLRGFGFTDSIDFSVSSFGHILNIKIISILSVLSLIANWISAELGVSLPFLFAYLVLILFEWATGIIAAVKKGEKHSSRKLGRMLFKITVYAIPLYIFNSFQREVSFLKVGGYELDIFLWFYWTLIIVIIWQLFVSVLENLDKMDIRFAKVLLKIINNKFYKKFNLTEKDIENNDSDTD